MPRTPDPRPKYTSLSSPGELRWSAWHPARGYVLLSDSRRCVTPTSIRLRRPATRLASWHLLALILPGCTSVISPLFASLPSLPFERHVFNVPPFTTYSFTHEGAGTWKHKGRAGDYVVFHCRGDGGRFELKNDHGQVFSSRDNLKDGTEIWLIWPPGYRAENPAAGAMRAGTDAAAAIRGSTTMLVNSTPGGAYLRVNGIDRGTTPRILEFKADEPMHIKASLFGYKELERQLTPACAEFRTGRVELQLEAVPFYAQTVTSDIANKFISLKGLSSTLDPAAARLRIVNLALEHYGALDPEERSVHRVRTLWKERSLSTGERFVRLRNRFRAILNHERHPPQISITIDSERSVHPDIWSRSDRVFSEDANLIDQLHQILTSRSGSNDSAATTKPR